MPKIAASGLIPIASKLKAFTEDNVQIQNVWAQLRTNTGFLDEPAYVKDLEGGVYDQNGEHFRFESIKEKCTTVYLVLPSNQMEPTKGGKWARLIVGDALNALLSSPRSQKHPSVLLMLDEAGTLGQLPGIREAANTLRDHGGTIWFFFQMLKQMEEIYGREGAEILMGACGAKTIFRTGDLATSEYVSKYCGKRTEMIATESGGSRPDAQGHHVNYHPSGVNLYGSDDVTWNLLPGTALGLFDDLPGPIEVELPAIHDPEMRYMMRDLRPNPYAPPRP
jgi:type IV secretory pathway TraG/TraD family ATPase VirD4